MPLSEPPDISRAPAVQVIANGRTLGGVISARLRSTNYFSADTFNVSLALDADPQFGSAFWSRQAPIQLEVRVKTDNRSAFASLVTGFVDFVSIDPIAHAVDVEGRDLSSSLIDSPIGGTFTNQTASDIMSVLAERHGLSPSVTPTSRLVGRYYQDGRDLVTLENFCAHATEWDFASFLAQEEDFDLFVSGNTLHFQPISPATDPKFVYRPADLISASLERLVPLSGDIEVTVRSWNSRDHVAVVQTAGTTEQTGGSVVQGTPRRHVLIQPNLTPDSARRLASRRLAELRRHDKQIRLVMPGDPDLTPRDLILLEGTFSDFDRVYRIDVIERRFSFSSGFVQLVRASNIL